MFGERWFYTRLIATQKANGGMSGLLTSLYFEVVCLSCFQYVVKWHPWVPEGIAGISTGRKRQVKED